MGTAVYVRTVAGGAGVALRSIQHPDAKVSVLYRYGEVEVMVVEVGALGSVMDSTLWSGTSWHLVVEGEAVFQQGDRTWEILPEESLDLPAGTPYTIMNPSRERLRLLSLVVQAGARAEKEELA